MYIFSQDAYLRLSELLIEAISDSNYINGVIEFEHEETEISITLSAIIYRSKTLQHPDAICGFPQFHTDILDIIPVWWEVKTIVNFEEVMNDFDFKILRNIIYI